MSEKDGEIEYEKVEERPTRTVPITGFMGRVCWKDFECYCQEKPTGHYGLLAYVPDAPNPQDPDDPVGPRVFVTTPSGCECLAFKGPPIQFWEELCAEFNDAELGQERLSELFEKLRPFLPTRFTVDEICPGADAISDAERDAAIADGTLMTLGCIGDRLVKFKTMPAYVPPDDPGGPAIPAKGEVGSVLVIGVPGDDGEPIEIGQTVIPQIPYNTGTWIACEAGTESGVPIMVIRTA